MSVIKYFICFILLTFSSEILSQDQSIFVFDPAGVSTSYQYTLSQLTEDSVFVVDSLDDSIFNYDAAFLFISFPNPLSEANVNRLINYTSTGKPTYLFAQPIMDPNTTPFWNHIGLYDIIWLLTSTFVDSITGIDTVFTKGVIIDTSFMNWAGVPLMTGEMTPILHAWSTPIAFEPTYISMIDTLKVILDLYNLIDDEGFLRRVLEYFELQPPNYVDEEIILLTEFVLSQNYPNPFNPVTSIQYAISSRQFVSLKVYDVLGNEIATLVDEEKEPGNYEVEFNTSSIKHHLSSGIYFYQLKVGAPETSSGQAFIETKKMILMK